MPEDYREKILDWFEQRLGTGNEFFFPLKKLREELVSGLSITIPPAEEIEGWLKGDDRFYLLPEPEGFSEHSPDEKDQMEKLGFFDGPRVGLKDKRPTPQQVAEKLREHTAKLINALQKAYESRDRDAEGSGKFEDRLLGLLRHAQKLQQDLPKLTEEL